MRRGRSLSGSPSPYRPSSGTRATNASRRESGLHTGSLTPSGWSVTLRGSPPPVGIT
ncbi:hypothetical protein ACFQQB_59295 [Nonomuraea rubra]|uniref:hypothetical protein n=1 Tax=Nonomuraea rubra TaxID=46180 RepID=UPI003613E024